jgi:hypothetical protein
MLYKVQRLFCFELYDSMIMLCELDWEGSGHGLF